MGLGELMDTLKEKFGARLKEIRKSKNMTQENLAEITGMDIPNLSNIERGKKFVSSETLSKLATALNVSESELFNFGHKKSREELIDEIQKLIHSSDLSNLEFIYKTLINLNLLN